MKSPWGKNRMKKNSVRYHKSENRSTEKAPAMGGFPGIGPRVTRRAIGLKQRIIIRPVLAIDAAHLYNEPAKGANRSGNHTV